MCSLGYCHAFLLSTAGVVGLEQPYHTSGGTLYKLHLVGYINYTPLLVSACLMAFRLSTRSSTLYAPVHSCLTVVGIYSVSTQRTGSEICSEEKFPNSKMIIHIHCELAIHKSFYLFAFALVQTGNDVKPE